MVGSNANVPKYCVVHSIDEHVQRSCRTGFEWCSGCQGWLVGGGVFFQCCRPHTQIVKASRDCTRYEHTGTFALLLASGSNDLRQRVAITVLRLRAKV